MRIDPTPSTAMTPRELARWLRVGVSRVRTWIRDGELPAVNVADPGRPPRYVVLPEHLAAFLGGRRTTAPPPKPARRRKRTSAIDYYP
jgi:excisionase family DNA binding protein